MIMHTDNKIIYIDNIPSNIFSEAIFILKNHIEDKEVNDEKSREILLNEAENIVEEYILKIKNEQEDKEQLELKQTNNKFGEIIYDMALFIILLVCIFIVM